MPGTHKSGGEFFTQLPRSGETTIDPGTYYLLVASEGQNPSANRIGTGAINYTLESLGVSPVGDLGTLPAAGTLSEAASYEAGEVRLHRFTLPEGILAVEVRLENRVGNPRMGMRRGSAAAPNLTITDISNTQIYGYFSGWTSNKTGESTTVLTEANPPAGVYSLVVAHGGSVPQAGSYTLVVEALVPATVPMHGHEATVTGLPAGEWVYHRIDVPEEIGGQPVEGWELRLVEWEGARPALHVRRDLLPPVSGSTFSPFSNNFTHFGNHTAWPSGWGTSKSSGDWTGRSWSADGTQSDESYLISFGMGQPLEPGTYYVGFQHTTTGSESTFTWTSRAIGGDGSGLDYEIRPLATGGSVSGTLEPRGVSYYAVEVPEGTPSQRFRLSLPAGHEGQLYIRRAVLSNTQRNGGSNRDPSTDHVQLDKLGGEFFTQLPRSGQTMIDPGTYYLMVVSEGQNPISASRIGTGAIDYMLENLGVSPVGDLGELPMSGALSQAGSYQSGEVRLHQFTVPEGLMGLEVRLEDRVGSPRMAIRRGTAAAPTLGIDGGFWSGVGIYGYFSGWTSNKLGESYTLLTEGNPAAGVYSVVVGHGGTTPQAGSYTLTVEALGTLPVPMHGHEATVTGLGSGEWIYYRIDVPEEIGGHAVEGWELRVTEWEGTRPRMYVRRDLLPTETRTGFASVANSSLHFSNHTAWPSSWGISTDSGDWTGRSQSADGSQSNETYLISCGMGQPLEPGTYFVGFQHTSTGQSTFTWTSRAIGGDGSGLDYEIRPLPTGGSVSGTLEPRGVSYYAVEVPEGTPSQRFRLSLPAGHEGQLYIRQAVLPNLQRSSANNSDPSTGQVRLNKSGGEFFTQLPRAGETTIGPGTYHLMVVSEGQNPSTATRIGTGRIDYTLENLGEAPVSDMGTLSASGTLSQTGSYEPGEVRLHRFTVPEGLPMLEVRLEDREGNPAMRMRRDDIAPNGLSGFSLVALYGYYSGRTVTRGGDRFILIELDAPDGVYSLVIGHNGASPQTGSYTLVAEALAPVTLAVSAEGTTSPFFDLIAGQSRFFQIEVPEEVNGEPVLGWQFDLVENTGSARLRIRKDEFPTGSSTIGQTAWQSDRLLAVPGYLTPGTWYVEMQGVTPTTVALRSTPVFEDVVRRHWAMPAVGESASAPGLDGARFADTGIDADGNPLPEDQGTDLPGGDYHIYAIDVPPDNGGLLRTVIESIGGNPNLYIRPALLPSLDHRANGGSGADMYLHRLDQSSATLYGSWVPFNVGTDNELEVGRWYLMVHAAGDTNARYRLRLSRAAAPLIQDMDLVGGTYENQSLASTDWRYYRVQIPAAGDLPDEWHIQFSQTQGSVSLYLRDRAPPGHWEQRVVGGGTNYSNPRDWYTDGRDPGNYRRFTSPGTHIINGADLRPGHTYYLGFRASGDSVFSVSSAVGGDVGGTGHGEVTTISSAGGSASVVLAPGEARTWQTVLPFEATRWRHTSVHDAPVEVFLRSNYLPNLSGTGNTWQSDGAANSGRNQNLSQLERIYYLTAVNTSASPQSFDLSIDWRFFELVRTAENGTIARNPNRAIFDPGETVILTANPAAGFFFTGWSGDAAGDTNPFTLTMDDNKAITANFAAIQQTLTLFPTRGEILVDPAKATYDQGETILLTAVAPPGYTFGGWSGSLGGTQNPQSLVMSVNRTVSAFFTPDDDGFADWEALDTLPPDRRGPLDRNGPLNLPNLMSHAMGLNPLEGQSADLPKLDAVDHAAGRAWFSFRRAKEAGFADLSIEQSINLQQWQEAEPLDWMVIQDFGDAERVLAELEIPDGSDRFFARLATRTTAPMWRAASLDNAPQGASRATVLWTGEEMIVWGGRRAGGDRINTGGRYDPATDQWQAVTQVNAPSARAYHTAVWTGTEMIVWGGEDGDAGANPFGDGARYNPATDTWAPLSMVNAPSPRSRHTAVWTGTEMIIWGGKTGPDQATDTGARYNPATDTWTALPLTGAPVARKRAVAVWTGTEMLVWGGENGAQTTSQTSGAHYDPATDTWEAIPTTGAPDGRAFFPPVWSGEELIVWGGFRRGANQVNTGGLYNPQTRTWRTLGLNGSPPSRRNAHAAVWTGNAMIVLGGFFGSALDDGGIYYPDANVWEPLPTLGRSTPRHRVEAIWTGSEFITWGGNDGSDFYDDAHRLSP
ncbi:MAG: hypothetical protein JJU00_18985 [Opitutales bacterium]|nr:hypothetical protein [Opitutales bacterium]